MKRFLWPLLGKMVPIRTLALCNIIQSSIVNFGFCVEFFMLPNEWHFIKPDDNCGE